MEPSQADKRAIAEALAAFIGNEIDPGDSFEVNGADFEIGLRWVQDAAVVVSFEDSNGYSTRVRVSVEVVS